MLTVGIAVIVIVGLLVAAIVLENLDGQATLSLAGQDLTVETWGLVVFGVVLGVLLVVGTKLAGLGLVQAGRRRRDERRGR
ncbi:MAG: hypothetical protein IRZ08_10565, partial [Frankia sp.]|nr:hypothetical protein [Frankia sp.]